MNTKRTFPRNWSKWLPTPGSILFTLLIAALLLYTQRANALLGLTAPQAPSATSTTTLPYQGRLTDTSGNPINAIKAMTFRLYNVESGGTELWQETWSTVNVSDGLFNVLLGSTTPIPQNVITENDNLWLGVTVGADTQMLPRIQIGSVPFSTQALSMQDGAISTKMLEDNAITQAEAISGVVNDSTSATDWVDLPGRAITTTTTSGAVLTMFAGSFLHQSSETMAGYWRIIRDDAILIAYNNHQFHPNFNEWITINLIGMDTPPAGQHTYKVQWHVSSSTIYASQATYTENFVVIELKK